MYNNQSADNLVITNALIEQHLHGGFGIDFAKCSCMDFLEFSKKILRCGVCGFFPTLATDTVENLKEQISEINKAMKIQESALEPMAKILGVHLEACFLNPLKKGIHNQSQLLIPNIDNYKLLEDDAIKIVTLAPELDKDYELCKYLKRNGIRVSAGHCLATDLSVVNQVTHLYNAMGTFSHKEPSTAVSALSSDNLYTEIIADFKHVQKEVLKITFRVKPLSRVILISDALPITHSNLETMEFCSKQIFLKGGKAVDASGTMAGSTSFVCDIIKGLVKEGLLDLQTAVAMASANINYSTGVDCQIYWDNDFNISAMNYNGNIITF